jgi:hypothetical protein
MVVGGAARCLPSDEGETARGWQHDRSTWSLQHREDSEWSGAQKDPSSIRSVTLSGVNLRHH